ncbi:MAG: Ig-like domain-containing protein [Candidatus Methanoperedens sp.]|nr:Ig-like domain-containing protein [Candidatus Methanoperedens sp.]
MKWIKQMNNKLKIGMLLLIVALVVVPGATAVSSYVTPLNTLYGPGLSCGTCHSDPAGGGPRNAYGTAFSTAMRGGLTVTQALTSIGAPPGVITPTPTATPIPTPTPIPVLTTIKVSPSTASLTVNGTQTFTAKAYDQMGNIFSVIFAWMNSNPTVGTFDTTTGKFTALSAGTTTITATNGTITGSAIVTVGALPAGHNRTHEREDHSDSREHRGTTGRHEKD